MKSLLRENVCLTNQIEVKGVLKKLQYQLTNSEKLFEDFGPVMVYGIDLSVFEEGDLKEHIAIEDISSKRDFVEFLVNRFNENIVFPETFQDLVEDYIC